MTTVFRNGAVFDGHVYRGRADVAVHGGRVLAVGPDLADADLPGPVEEVDCAGGLVLPGFVDAHVHAVQGGLERIRCDLSEVPETREDYLAAIAEYASRRAQHPWILGGGWSLGAFPGGTPRAADLDAIVPDRPVFLPNRDHHGAWVNSVALERAGIDADTPDPADGRIERDTDGRPTGTLHAGAMRLVTRHLPRTRDAEYYAALMEGQRYLHSLGVTGWQDAIVGAYAGMDDISPVYLRAASRGALTAHVVGALWWERGRGVEQISELRRRREELTEGRFRATSVKVMQDGGVENRTAALLEPYLDDAGASTHDLGISFLTAAGLTAAVAALTAVDFQVHVHAVGDRAIRESLDAFEALGPGGAAAGRHHLAHVQVMHPDDVGRFAELGVAANLQMLWACHEPEMTRLTIPYLGPERSARQYVFAELHAAGARLAGGSDWPVSTPDPLQAVHTAVNRTLHGDPGAAGSTPFLPEQALDLATALAAYTSGSAWVNHRDDAGTLEPGQAADVVVLDRDPFAGPAEEIGAARVVSTWIDGEVVHG